jgi:hypothetical protein
MSHVFSEHGYKVRSQFGEKKIRGAAGRKCGVEYCSLSRQMLKESQWHASYGHDPSLKLAEGVKQLCDNGAHAYPGHFYCIVL